MDWYLFEFFPVNFDEAIVCVLIKDSKTHFARLLEEHLELTAFVAEVKEEQNDLQIYYHTKSESETPLFKLEDTTATNNTFERLYERPLKELGAVSDEVDWWCEKLRTVEHYATWERETTTPSKFSE